MSGEQPGGREGSKKMIRTSESEGKDRIDGDGVNHPVGQAGQLVLLRLVGRSEAVGDAGGDTVDHDRIDTTNLGPPALLVDHIGTDETAWMRRENERRGRRKERDEGRRILLRSGLFRGLKSIRLLDLRRLR